MQERELQTKPSDADARIVRVVVGPRPFTTLTDDAKRRFAAGDIQRSGDTVNVLPGNAVWLTQREWDALPAHKRANLEIPSDDRMRDLLTATQRTVTNTAKERRDKVAVHLDAKRAERDKIVMDKNAEIRKLERELDQAESEFQASLAVETRTAASIQAQMSAERPGIMHSTLSAVAGLLLAFFVMGGSAMALTPTPTDTPTNTPTNTATPTSTFTPIVNTPVPVSTATPVPGANSISNSLYGSSIQRDGNLLVHGNVIFYPTDSNGNAGASYSMSGPLRQACVSVGTMTNGTTAGLLLLDDSPTGEWTVEPNDGTVVASSDTTNYRVGTHSLKVAYQASAVAGAGVHRTLSTPDWTTAKSVGFWAYSSEQVAAADFIFIVDDATQNTQYQLPALPKNRWTWVEIDITDLAGGRGDAVTGVELVMTSHGATAHGAMSLYLDFMYKWNASDEEALALNAVAYHILTDGVFSYWTMITTSPTGTSTDLIPYVDYFPAYRTVGDVLVTQTDQSANSGRSCFMYQ